MEINPCAEKLGIDLHDHVDCISGVHLLREVTFASPNKAICNVHGRVVIPVSLLLLHGHPTLEVYDGLWMHIGWDSNC